MNLEYVSSLDALRDDWSALARRTDNVFATWEWASAWWRHFGGGARALWTRCRGSDAATVVVLPLYLRRRAMLRVVRLVGDGPADELGPLCAAADRSVAGAALGSVLDEVRADLFVGECLRHEDEWPKHLRAKVHATRGSPILRLGGRSWLRV